MVLRMLGKIAGLTAVIATVCVLFGVGVGTAGAAPADTSRYRNPVFQHDFPDPTVIRADGWYYAYGRRPTRQTGTSTSSWRGRAILSDGRTWATHCPSFRSGATTRSSV